MFDGRRTFTDAMSEWHRARDERATPMYEFTTQMATLESPPPEMQQLLTAVHGNQIAMDDFVSVIADTVSPIAFFDPLNLAQIMHATQRVSSGALT